MTGPKRPRPDQADQDDADTPRTWEPYKHADGETYSEDPTDW